MAESNSVNEFQQHVALQQQIQQTISERFAPEDDGLRNALTAAREQGLPEIQMTLRPLGGSGERAYS